MNHSKRILFFSAAVLASSIPAQGDEGRPGIASRMASEIAAKPGASPMLVESLKHVDYGGQFLGYVEVKGDLERMAAMFQELVESAGADVEQIPPGLDLISLLKMTGFGDVRSLAASSVEDGTMFRNRAFIDLGGQRKGILKMLGGEPKKPLSFSLVPEDADLVYERDFDLTVLNEMITDVGKQLGGEARQNLQGMVSQPTPMGMTVEEIIGKAKGRLLLFVNFDAEAGADPAKRIPVPNAPGLTLPPLDVVIVAEGMDWIFESMVSSGPPDLKQLIKGEPGSRILQAQSMGPGALGRIQPTVIEDAANSRLIMTTSPAYWEKCKGEGLRLTDNAGFKAAFKDLPSESNGLIYVSSDAKKELVSAIELYFEEAIENGGSLKEIVDMIVNLVKGDPEAEAAVQVNHPQGILIAGNNTNSMKDTVLVVPAASVGAMFGLLSVREVEGVGAVEAMQLEAMDADRAAMKSALDETRRDIPMVREETSPGTDITAEEETRPIDSATQPE